MTPWIGVDFDGTLAGYESYQGVGNYGPPIPAMVERVKAWLAAGKVVKIFTARAADPTEVTAIYGWCLEHLGVVLEVTNVKDYGMVALYDDRCVQVEANTGRLLVDDAIVRLSNTLAVAKSQNIANAREIDRLRQHIERLTTLESER